KGYGAFASRALVAQAQHACLGERLQTRVPEPQAHARMPRRFFDQHPVELGTADGVDDLVLALAIGLQLCLTGHGVDHPSPHRNQQRTNALHHSRALERPDAAGGEGEIDGSPALALRLPRVGPALVDVHRECAAGQQNCEQRPCEAGAHDVDRPIGERGHGSRRRACASAWAPWNTSEKLLYNGMGARRMVSGSRQSPITPRAVRASKTRRPRPGEPTMRTESWQPRESTARCVMSSTSGARWSRRDSRKPVSMSDFCRNRCKPAAPKSASEAMSGAAERIGGLLICQPAAPAAAWNSGRI